MSFLIFFVLVKVEKIRAQITKRGEVVAGFTFACSITELQKSHVSNVIYPVERGKHDRTK